MVSCVTEACSPKSFTTNEEDGWEEKQQSNICNSQYLFVHIV